MIYYLHEDAAENAKLLDDKTLDKQIKAIAQTLYNAHYKFHFNNKTKINPIPPLNAVIEQVYSGWTSECLANYKKLADMGIACCWEYSYRFCNACDKCEDFFECQECEKCLGIGFLLYTKKHKLLSVIEWCNQNVPDLPDKKGCRVCHCSSGWSFGHDPLPCHACDATGTIKIKTTPFPLVMPEEYKYNNIYSYLIKHGHEEFKGINLVVESYRNYYRAQLEKLADRHIKCKFDTHDRDVKAYGQCAECLTRSGSVPKPIVPTWNRRQPPSWLNFNWNNNIP